MRTQGVRVLEVYSVAGRYVGRIRKYTGSGALDWGDMKSIDEIAIYWDDDTMCWGYDRTVNTDTLSVGGINMFYLRDPSASSETCPKCGARGVFIRMAMVCPNHRDMLLGGC